MKIKVATLANSKNDLGKLLNAPMKAKTAWKLAKIANELDEKLAPINKAIESSRLEHTKKGVLDQEGFEKDISGLFEEEIDLDFEQISISEIEDIDNIEPRVFIVLRWLIVG